MKKKKRLIIILVCIVGSLALFFRLFCGIFVIQPIGAVPEGAYCLLEKWIKYPIRSFRRWIAR